MHLLELVSAWAALCFVCVCAVCNQTFMPRPSNGLSQEPQEFSRDLKTKLCDSEACGYTRSITPLQIWDLISAWMYSIGG